MEEKKKLYRSRANRRLLGVCGGLAEYFDVDATIMRIIFVVLVLVGTIGIIGYLILALIMPEK